MSQQHQQQQNGDSRIPYPENTVFFVPEIPYDVQVIRGYLNKKYKGIPKDMIVSQVNMTALPHIENMKFIVCVRRGNDGPPGPEHHIVPDERGVLRTKPISPETYHNEVHESAVIKVRDHISVSKGSLFAPTETNLNALIDVLANEAYPCRVFPQNKPDTMLRFVVGV
jgi:hypothetical protein